MLTLGRVGTHIDIGVVQCENISDEIECELGWVIRKWSEYLRILLEVDGREKFDAIRHLKNQLSVSQGTF